MSTLLLCLKAPMQSWGLNSKFDRRGTETVPTKSGVIGLLAAALGRGRSEDLSDLQALRFGVRVDYGGKLIRDYHTAKSQKSTYVTNRYYLSDAVFLAGVMGDDAFLRDIEYALGHPAFPLFLGRRSCPPEGRLSLGIRPGKDLFDALCEEPWLAADWYKRKANKETKLRIIMDAGEGEPHTYFQRDVPLSFDQAHRKYGFRLVRGDALCVVPGFEPEAGRMEPPTGHDPMVELRGDA